MTNSKGRRLVIHRLDGHVLATSVLSLTCLVVLRSILSANKFVSIPILVVHLVNHALVCIKLHLLGAVLLVAHFVRVGLHSTSLVC